MGYHDLPALQVTSRVLRTRPSQGGCLRARPSGRDTGSIPVWATTICRLCKLPAASCGRDPLKAAAFERARPGATRVRFPYGLPRSAGPASYPPRPADATPSRRLPSSAPVRARHRFDSRMGYHDLPALQVTRRVLRTRPSQGGCLRARPSGRDTGSIPVWATTICRPCKLPAASSGRDPLKAAAFERARPGATRVRFPYGLPRSAGPASYPPRPPDATLSRRLPLFCAPFRGATRVR